MTAIGKVVVVHGGELAQDIADQIKGHLPVDVRSASERPTKLVGDVDSTALVCFIVQTIENGAPTEEGGTTVRFFKRKTHAKDLLVGFNYCVLGVGDSNLLLDRQTTTASDCNQVAKELDQLLETLGGSRYYELGLADERTGLQEVDPWIAGLWAKLRQP